MHAGTSSIFLPIVQLLKLNRLGQHRFDHPTSLSPDIVLSSANTVSSVLRWQQRGHGQGGPQEWCLCPPALPSCCNFECSSSPAGEYLTSHGMAGLANIALDTQMTLILEPVLAEAVEISNMLHTKAFRAHRCKCCRKRRTHTCWKWCWEQCTAHIQQV